MNKMLAGMQTYFFPYMGYFQLIDAVDEFQIYEHFTFRKQSWMTRNRIIGKGNPLPFYIAVPVLNSSSNLKISEVRINNKTNWKKKLLTSITLTYKKALFFDEIFPLLQKLIEADCDSLHVYNAKTTIGLCKYLEIDTKIEYNNSDFIEKSLKGMSIEENIEEKTMRIIELCKNKKATIYVNASNGKSLYNKNDFNNYDLQLKFIETLPYSYNQFNPDNFEPHLSIIDMLMHNGLDKTKQLVKNYKLS